MRKVSEVAIRSAAKRRVRKSRGEQEVSRSNEEVQRMVMYGFHMNAGELRVNALGL
jgi:hypothetical protein